MFGDIFCTFAIVAFIRYFDACRQRRSSDLAAPGPGPGA